MSGAVFNYATPEPASETLVDVLDRVLDVGVVAKGDLTISVADVDLIYIGLKLLICSPDQLEQLHQKPATLLVAGEVS